MLGVSRIIMPPKISRKRKKTLVGLAKEMREKKVTKQSAEQHQEQESLEPTSGDLDESLQLPRPSGMAVLDDKESDGEEYRGEFTYGDAQGCYENWLLVLEKEHIQMMAMMLYCTFWAASDKSSRRSCSFTSSKQENNPKVEI